ncbi:PPC domain-containing DNA-binding protein [Persephonella sp.]
MNYRKIDDIYLLCLQEGEKVISSIENFVKFEGINSGFFWAVGAVRNVELGIFDIDDKDYIKAIFKDYYEIVSCHGNISMDPDTQNPVIHTHISIADKDFRLYGGHLFEAEVTVTFEMVLFPVAVPIIRNINPKFNLKLWKVI